MTAPLPPRLGFGAALVLVLVSAVTCQILLGRAEGAAEQNLAGDSRDENEDQGGAEAEPGWQGRGHLEISENKYEQPNDRS